MFKLAISETADWHDEGAGMKQLAQFLGDKETLIEPFRLALGDFATKYFDAHHWHYHVDINSLTDL